MPVVKIAKNLEINITSILPQDDSVSSSLVRELCQYAELYACSKFLSRTKDNAKALQKIDFRIAETAISRKKELKLYGELEELVDTWYAKESKRDEAEVNSALEDLATGIYTRNIEYQQAVGYEVLQKPTDKLVDRTPIGEFSVLPSDFELGHSGIAAKGGKYVLSLGGAYDPEVSSHRSGNYKHRLETKITNSIQRYFPDFAFYSKETRSLILGAIFDALTQAGVLVPTQQDKSRIDKKQYQVELEGKTKGHCIDQALDGLVKNNTLLHDGVREYQAVAYIFKKIVKDNKHPFPEEMFSAHGQEALEDLTLLLRAFARRRHITLNEVLVGEAYPQLSNYNIQYNVLDKIAAVISARIGKPGKRLKLEHLKQGSGLEVLLESSFTQDKANNLKPTDDHYRAATIVMAWSLGIKEEELVLDTEEKRTTHQGWEAYINHVMSRQRGADKYTQLLADLMAADDVIEVLNARRAVPAARKQAMIGADPEGLAPRKKTISPAVEHQLGGNLDYRKLLAKLRKGGNHATPMSFDEIKQVTLVALSKLAVFVETMAVWDIELPGKERLNQDKIRQILEKLLTETNPARFEKGVENLVGKIVDLVKQCKTYHIAAAWAHEPEGGATLEGLKTSPLTVKAFYRYIQFVRHPMLAGYVANVALEQDYILSMIENSLEDAVDLSFKTTKKPLILKDLAKLEKVADAIKPMPLTLKGDLSNVRKAIRRTTGPQELERYVTEYSDRINAHMQLNLVVRTRMFIGAVKAELHPYNVSIDAFKAEQDTTKRNALIDAFKAGLTTRRYDAAIDAFKAEQDSAVRDRMIDAFKEELNAHEWDAKVEIFCQKIFTDREEQRYITPEMKRFIEAIRKEGGTVDAIEAKIFDFLKAHDVEVDMRIPLFLQWGLQAESALITTGGDITKTKAALMLAEIPKLGELIKAAREAVEANPKDEQAIHNAIQKLQNKLPALENIGDNPALRSLVEKVNALKNGAKLNNAKYIIETLSSYYNAGIHFKNCPLTFNAEDRQLVAGLKEYAAVIGGEGLVDIRLCKEGTEEIIFAFSDDRDAIGFAVQPYEQLLQAKAPKLVIKAATKPKDLDPKKDAEKKPVTVVVDHDARPKRKNVSARKPMIIELGEDGSRQPVYEAKRKVKKPSSDVEEAPSAKKTAKKGTEVGDRPLSKAKKTSSKTEGRSPKKTAAPVATKKDEMLPPRPPKPSAENSEASFHSEEVPSAKKTAKKGTEVGDRPLSKAKKASSTTEVHSPKKTAAPVATQTKKFSALPPPSAESSEESYEEPLVPHRKRKVGGEKKRPSGSEHIGANPQGEWNDGVFEVTVKPKAKTETPAKTTSSTAPSQPKKPKGVKFEGEGSTTTEEATTPRANTNANVSVSTDANLSSVRRKRAVTQVVFTSKEARTYSHVYLGFINEAMKFLRDLHQEIPDAFHDKQWQKLKKDVETGKETLSAGLLTAKAEIHQEVTNILYPVMNHLIAAEAWLPELGFEGMLAALEAHGALFIEARAINRAYNFQYAKDDELAPVFTTPAKGEAIEKLGKDLAKYRKVVDKLLKKQAPEDKEEVLAHLDMLGAAITGYAAERNTIYAAKQAASHYIEAVDGAFLQVEAEGNWDKRVKAAIDALPVLLTSAAKERRKQAAAIAKINLDGLYDVAQLRALATAAGDLLQEFVYAFDIHERDSSGVVAFRETVNKLLEQIKPLSVAKALNGKDQTELKTLRDTVLHQIARDVTKQVNGYWEGISAVPAQRQSIRVFLGIASLFSPKAEAARVKFTEKDWDKLCVLKKKLDSLHKPAKGTEADNAQRVRRFSVAPQLQPELSAKEEKRLWQWKAAEPSGRSPKKKDEGNKGNVSTDSMSAQPPAPSMLEMGSRVLADRNPPRPSLAPNEITSEQVTEQDRVAEPLSPSEGKKPRPGSKNKKEGGRETRDALRRLEAEQRALALEEGSSSDEEDSVLTDEALKNKVVDYFYDKGIFLAEENRRALENLAAAWVASEKAELTPEIDAVLYITQLMLKMEKAFLGIFDKESQAKAKVAQEVSQYTHRLLLSGTTEGEASLLARLDKVIVQTIDTLCREGKGVYVSKEKKIEDTAKTIMSSVAVIDVLRAIQMHRRTQAAIQERLRKEKAEAQKESGVQQPATDTAAEKDTSYMAQSVLSGEGSEGDEPSLSEDSNQGPASAALAPQPTERKGKPGSTPGKSMRRTVIISPDQKFIAFVTTKIVEDHRIKDVRQIKGISTLIKTIIGEDKIDVATADVSTVAARVFADERFREIVGLVAVATTKIVESLNISDSKQIESISNLIKMIIIDDEIDVATADVNTVVSLVIADKRFNGIVGESNGLFAVLATHDEEKSQKRKTPPKGEDTTQLRQRMKEEARKAQEEKKQAEVNEKKKASEAATARQRLEELDRQEEELRKQREGKAQDKAKAWFVQEYILFGLIKAIARQNEPHPSLNEDFYPDFEDDLQELVQKIVNWQPGDEPASFKELNRKYHELLEDKDILIQPQDVERIIAKLLDDVAVKMAFWTAYPATQGRGKLNISAEGEQKAKVREFMQRTVFPALFNAIVEQAPNNLLVEQVKPIRKEQEEVTYKTADGKSATYTPVIDDDSPLQEFFDLITTGSKVVEKHPHFKTFAPVRAEYEKLCQELNASYKESQTLPYYKALVKRLLDTPAVQQAFGAAYGFANMSADNYKAARKERIVSQTIETLVRYMQSAPGEDAILIIGKPAQPIRTSQKAREYLQPMVEAFYDQKAKYFASVNNYSAIEYAYLFVQHHEPFKQGFKTHFGDDVLFRGRVLADIPLLSEVQPSYAGMVERVDNGAAIYEVIDSFTTKYLSLPTNPLNRNIVDLNRITIGRVYPEALKILKAIDTQASLVDHSVKLIKEDRKKKAQIPQLKTKSITQKLQNFIQDNLEHFPEHFALNKMLSDFGVQYLGLPANGIKWDMVEWNPTVVDVHKNTVEILKESEVQAALRDTYKVKKSAIITAIQTFMDDNMEYFPPTDVPPPVPGQSTANANGSKEKGNVSPSPSSPKLPVVQDHRDASESDEEEMPSGSMVIIDAPGRGQTLLWNLQIIKTVKTLSPEAQARLKAFEEKFAAMGERIEDAQMSLLEQEFDRIENGEGPVHTPDRPSILKPSRNGNGHEKSITQFFEPPVNSGSTAPQEQDSVVQYVSSPPPNKQLPALPVEANGVPTVELSGLGDSGQIIGTYVQSLTELDGTLKKPSDVTVGEYASVLPSSPRANGNGALLRQESDVTVGSHSPTLAPQPSNANGGLGDQAEVSVASIAKKTAWLADTLAKGPTARPLPTPPDSGTPNGHVNGTPPSTPPSWQKIVGGAKKSASSPVRQSKDITALLYNAEQDEEGQRKFSLRELQEQAEGVDLEGFAASLTHGSSSSTTTPQGSPPGSPRNDQGRG